MLDGNAQCANNTWRKNKFKTSASGPFPGVPFAPCIRYGNLVATTAEQGRKVAKDGKSLAKDAGSAVKDAAKSLF
jgi:hypothetical protein